jgi:hypothetical protein
MRTFPNGASVELQAAQLCEECGHKVSLHDDLYGCRFERGDAWVTWNQPEASTVLMAQGPCGCTAWTVEKLGEQLEGR